MLLMQRKLSNILAQWYSLKTEPKYKSYKFPSYKLINHKLANSVRDIHDKWAVKLLSTDWKLTIAS